MLPGSASYLKCLRCSGDINHSFGATECRVCGHRVLREGGALIFKEGAIARDEDTSLTLWIKDFLKKQPRLFFLLYYTLGVFVGKSAKTAIKDLSEGAIIFNIASGIKIIRSDVINIDIEPYPNVSIVGDATRLPLKDGIADAVICEASLEHFLEPEKAVQEMWRILKPGGRLYASVPFIVGFHASPHDYYRWTEAGVRELFSEFHPAEIGVGWGPTYALTSILREWLALVLSFNVGFLHQVLVLFFTVIFAPLNFLDYLFARFKLSKNIAFGFYFIGTKK